MLPRSPTLCNYLQGRGTPPDECTESILHTLCPSPSLACSNVMVNFLVPLAPTYWPAIAPAADRHNQAMLESLPDHLILRILGLLDDASVCALSQVCGASRAACMDDEAVWKPRCEIHGIHSLDGWAVGTWRNLRLGLLRRYGCLLPPSIQRQQGDINHHSVHDTLPSSVQPLGSSLSDLPPIALRGTAEDVGQLW